MRLRFPSVVSEELTYLSKRWMDFHSTKDARHSDAFLFYSGAGLHTLKALKPTRTVGVLEAVNSHILVQERILSEEHERLGLPLKGFHRREVARRVRECEMADGIICPSTFARQSFLDEGIEPARVRTVPFGVEFAPAGEPVERPPGTFRVLFVGQINIRKGLRYLFEAFKKFQHPKKELWIVGPRTEQTGIEDVTPPPGTKFLGVLKGGDLSRAYRSCDVFVLPTIEEGLALVIGEALSHGLPVIATENSGAADLFSDGSTGFHVPIRSPEAIAGKLQFLADNRDILEKMSRWTETSGQGLRTWEMTGQSLVETLRDFVEMPKR
jgi:glycosyltransferase involved in cell wall biosynthesis